MEIFQSSIGIAMVTTVVMASGGSEMSHGQSATSARPATAPTTGEAIKTYTFRNHTIRYPASWQLREKGGGAPATIYKPAGADSLTAWWYFDRKTDRQNRSAEQIRDDIDQSLAETFQGFKLKEKGSLKIDGKAAAFIRFEHAQGGVAAESRHVFVPTGDGFVIAISETSVAGDSANNSPKLNAITSSLRFPE